jgi:polar amino acid transport system substrate-binding protein
MKNFFVLLIIFLGVSPLYGSVQTINVGGYYFPPFIDQNKELQYVGVAIDLIEEMNKFQNTFLFKFVPTSPKRRFSSFENEEFDLIMFENIAWGWEGMPITASNVILDGAEVYITKASITKNQRYFDDFEEKSIAVILGYHNGFSGLNADEKHLKEQYNIKFSISHERNLNRVLSNRVDISVISISYLNNYLNLHPKVKNQLLISEKFDQLYQHTLLLRDNSEMSIEQVNQLLGEMHKAGLLKKVWHKYGLELN